MVRGGLDLSALWPVAAARREALERLGGLLDRVAVWNARIDLTAARSERELVDLYLADALVLAAEGAARGATRPSERWIDVGSGAGAPGLALALLWRAPELTLVEPRQKRVAFLRTAAGGALAGEAPAGAALTDVGSAGTASTASTARSPLRVIEGRSDAVAAGEHDVAISRATFSPDEWLREGARLARRRVWVLLARATPPELPGWQRSTQIDYEWPLTQVPRQALAYTPAPGT